MQITKPPHNRYVLYCLDNALSMQMLTQFANVREFGEYTPF